MLYLTHLLIIHFQDEQTMSICNKTDLATPDNQEQVNNFQDICYVLVQYDFDWALFIQAMLEAASTNYGDPDFLDTLALPTNRILPLKNTDLLIQASLVPNSRIRQYDGNGMEMATSTAVYLGVPGPSSRPSASSSTASQLFTVILSAAYVIDRTGARFRYGSEDSTDELQTYTAKVPSAFSWSDWAPFFLWDSRDIGTILINNTQEVLQTTEATQPGSTFRTPFGGTNSTSVLQVAAISSAAGGNGSPLVSSVYAQFLSIGYFEIAARATATVWRVLAGIAAGLGATLLLGFGTKLLTVKCKPNYEEATANKIGGGVGVAFGILVGLCTGFFYGAGSIVVPNFFNKAVQTVYTNSTYDNFGVCSQWPNLPCGDADGFLIDGWFVDNPAFVINVAHQQLKMRRNETIKVIITNTNQVWNTTFNYVQFLQYFSAYFNQGVAPGGFLWAPGYWAPIRSPQIFEEPLDNATLDALLEPIPDSNMTTVRLSGTTVDNPSFGVSAGQSVKILLLNLNENITTFVIGQQQVNEFTQPLADMTRNIASNQELVRRVREFVDGPF
jgi:hypothetical protein